MPYANPKVNWPLIGQQVMRQYALCPSRIEQLLLRMGAQYLKPLGNRFQSTCPIHGGDNPRAMVVYFNQDVPVYQCFTHCGRGDLIAAVQKKYGLPFPKAVAFLAEQVGMSIEGHTVLLSEQDFAEAEARKIKLMLSRQAAVRPNYFPEQWVRYSRQVLRSPQCRAVLDYLLGPADQVASWGDRKRQFQPWTIDHWEVGFVPANTWVWDELDPKRGTPKRAGWFEDRISVPWRDINGHLIGFSGRRVDGVKTRKYQTINGTLKQFALYGLHHTYVKQAITDRREVVLVEGFADVWRAHEHGLYQAVGVGGTSLSPQQMRLLKQFVTINRVVLMFDGDEAGRVTTSNLAKQVYRVASPVAAGLPEGVDPADILDPQAFWGCVQGARALATV